MERTPDDRSTDAERAVASPDPETAHGSPPATTPAEDAVIGEREAGAPGHDSEHQADRERMHERDEHDPSRLGPDEHPGHPSVTGEPDPNG